jgi:hypothetical protein
LSRPDERGLVELTALTRFPDDDERIVWPARYAKPAAKTFLSQHGDTEGTERTKSTEKGLS